MNTLTKIAAIGLVVLAALLGFFAYRIASAPTPVAPARPAATANGPQIASTPTNPVMVAVGAIPAGKTLIASDLQVVRWPVVPLQAIVNPSDAIGKTVKFDIAAGEAITTNQLVQGLANYLKPDERAVSIATDELVGVANTVSPGDFVDIFLTLDKAGEVPGAQTRLVLSRVRVLAYGARSVDGPVGASASNPPPARGSPQYVEPRYTILAIPLDKVNELLLAAKSGRLSFALRSPHDDSLPDTTLFATREPVLPGKAGLSASQKLLLSAPENLAFAGDSLVQLAGPLPPAQTKFSAPRKRASGAGRTLQVIRGGQSQLVPY
jgi:pilus assembly protein CpaB